MPGASVPTRSLPLPRAQVPSAAAVGSSGHLLPAAGSPLPPRASGPTSREIPAGELLPLQLPQPPLTAGRARPGPAAGAPSRPPARAPRPRCFGGARRPRARRARPLPRLPQHAHRGAAARWAGTCPGGPSERRGRLGRSPRARSGPRGPACGAAEKRGTSPPPAAPLRSPPGTPRPRRAPGGTPRRRGSARPARPPSPPGPGRRRGLPALRKAAAAAAGPRGGRAAAGPGRPLPCGFSSAPLCARGGEEGRREGAARGDYFPRGRGEERGGGGGAEEERAPGGGDRGRGKDGEKGREGGGRGGDPQRAAAGPGGRARGCPERRRGAGADCAAPRRSYRIPPPRLYALALPRRPSAYRSAAADTGTHHPPTTPGRRCRRRDAAVGGTGEAGAAGAEAAPGAEREAREGRSGRPRGLFVLRPPCRTLQKGEGESAEEYGGGESRV